MRRIIILLTAALMVMGFAGCGKKESGAEPPVDTAAAVQETESDSGTEAVEIPEEQVEPEKTEEPEKQEEPEEPEQPADTEESKIKINDDFEVSGLKDQGAAGLFKEFLLGRETAEFNGDRASLWDLFMASFDEDTYDSENETLTENIAGNYAIHFAVSEASEPTLYIEIMNVMVAGTVYQIRIKGGSLFINSVLETGWSDSATVYSNGIMGIYHGMNLPVVDYYFDATEKIIDIYDGSSKAKLLIFGPKSFFDTDFDEALSAYQEQAENVLVFDEEMTEEITAKRDELLGISDSDAAEWTKLEVLDCKEK